MPKKVYFKLFSDCFIVDGQNGSLIYDINRNKLFPISNEVSSYIKEANGMEIREIERRLPSDFKIVFNEFIQKEIGFLHSESDIFPDINLEFDEPIRLYSSIIEIGETIEYDFENVLFEILNFGCKQIIVYFNLINNEILFRKTLEILLENIFDSFVTNLELIIPSTYEEIFNQIQIDENLRITSVLIFNAHQNNVLLCPLDVLKVYTTDKLINWTENISVENFSINVKLFSEAMHFNLGLNKKVTITQKGEIKNYINHERTFGNVNTNTIQDIISSTEFQEKWILNNDKIEKCKECKYRYCCVSNTDLYQVNLKWFKKNYCLLNVN